MRRPVRLISSHQRSTDPETLDGGMAMTLPSKGTYRFGIISDTHGYLPPQALTVFRNVDLILHAGDIGSATIVPALEKVAPVVAVRGNMDSGPWFERFAEKEFIQAGNHLIHLIHDAGRLRVEAMRGACLAVVNGHTHRPTVETKDGILFVNPGSAGAPRYGEHASVALLRVAGAHVSADVIQLQV
jgi:putative phosphoesterase